MVIDDFPRITYAAISDIVVLRLNAFLRLLSFTKFLLIMIRKSHPKCLHYYFIGGYTRGCSFFFFYALLSIQHLSILQYTLHLKTIPLGAISMSYPVAIAYKGTFAPRANWRSQATRNEWCRSESLPF